MKNLLDLDDEENIDSFIDMEAVLNDPELNRELLQLQNEIYDLPRKQPIDRLMNGNNRKSDEREEGI
jgi:hypothetical protein